MLNAKGMKNKKILIVEDNHESRALLGLILSRSGYDVVEAATGLEALDRARGENPDLIIMDLGLPGITGDEATARLKADPSTKHIPVLINTAFHKGGALVARAITVGAAEILYKPIGFKDIQAAMLRYLSPERNRNHVPLNPSTPGDRLSAAVA